MLAIAKRLNELNSTETQREREKLIDKLNEYELLMKLFGNSANMDVEDIVDANLVDTMLGNEVQVVKVAGYNMRGRPHIRNSLYATRGDFTLDSTNNNDVLSVVITIGEKFSLMIVDSDCKNHIAINSREVEMKNGKIITNINGVAIDKNKIIYGDYTFIFKYKLNYLVVSVKTSDGKYLLSNDMVNSEARYYFHVEDDTGAGIISLKDLEVTEP